MTMHRLPFAALLLLAASCTTPTAGKGKQEAGASASQDDFARQQAIWAATKIGLSTGEAHNLVPAETEMAKAAVEMRREDIDKCFESAVTLHGCRTHGIEQFCDFMLMIATDGSVREALIRAGKNELPRQCDAAVTCVRELLGQIQIQGLQRFDHGARQLMMTVSVTTPDEELLGMADGG